MSETFPAATEHGDLEDVLPGLFVVRGTVEFPQWKMVLSRNMIVARSEGELTLINAVRLDTGGLAALEALGAVKHVVRLGPGHGMDDPFYVDRYSPTYWAPVGAAKRMGLTPDRELGDDCPLGNAEVFTFRCARLPEVALRLETSGGTLITADAITNMVDTKGSSGVEQEMTVENGLLRRASIGARWRSSMTKEHGPSLLLDYQRLLEAGFVNLLSAHGPPLLDTADEDLRATLALVYGLRR